MVGFFVAKEWRLTKYMRQTLMIGLMLTGMVLAAPPDKTKENKADLSANVAINREVVQMLERSKKLLQSIKGTDPGAHRAKAIKHIMAAMGEVRGQTSKPGH